MATLYLNNDKLQIDSTGLITGTTYTPEIITNKTTVFTTLNDTLYPTVKAVDTHLIQNIAALAEYFFYNTAHAIGGGYLQMKQPASIAIVADIVNNTVTNGQTMAIFATNAGTPGVTFIPNGIVKLNIHALKSNSNQVVQLRGLIYTRNLAGVETLICTTDDSNILTTSNSNYLLSGTIPSIVNILSTDIYVVKIIAVVSGTGVAVNVTLGVEDSTVSSLGMPYSVKSIVPITTTDNAITRFDGTNGLTQNSDVLIEDTNNLVLSKTSGVGIKLDTTTPTFGFRDLIGQIVPRPSGNPAPTLAAFRGGVVLLYAFAANDVIDNIVFHIPHDYLPGSDMFLHIHWGHNGTAISGNLVINWSVMYGKGNQGTQTGQIFGTELTIPQTIPTANVTTYPRYSHNIEEIQITNTGGDSTHIDKSLIEPDGLLIVALSTTTIPTITGGTPNNPYFFTVDIHYQTTSVLGTKTKNYPFYT